MALVSLLLAGPALAWDEAKLKGQVQALLDQAAAGFDKKDVIAVLATSAPEAIIKYRDGRTMSMAQWAEAVAKDLADWKDVKSRFVVEQVWPRGKDRAGAVYKERHDFSRISAPGHKFAIVARFRVLLTKTPQGWRFLEFVDLGTQYLRDGKAFYPQAAPKKPAKPAKPAKTQG
ncbi:MAG: hypothetical protein AB1814_08560 [Thermodesulfobacteriota bacterium]